MNNSTTDIPILDDDAVAKLANRPWFWPAHDQWRETPLDLRHVILTVAERDALCQTVRALRAEKGRLATVSGEWAGLLDRIRAWSKCADGYPLDEHINNITTDRERLQSQLEQVTKERDELRQQLNPGRAIPGRDWPKSWWG